MNVTSIPAPRVPFIDERTGLISREWYRFFLNLFTLLGGGRNDTSLSDLQVGPEGSPDALALLQVFDAGDVAPEAAEPLGEALRASTEALQALPSGVDLAPVLQALQDLLLAPSAAPNSVATVIGYTVANLPAAPPAYTRAMVTDANATTFASVVAGGGANIVPVYFDATNWRIG